MHNGFAGEYAGLAQQADYNRAFVTWRQSVSDNCCDFGKASPHHQRTPNQHFVFVMAQFPAIIEENAQSFALPGIWWVSHTLRLIPF
jgi:hypothetical protein